MRFGRGGVVGLAVVVLVAVTACTTDARTSWRDGPSRVTPPLRLMAPDPLPEGWLLSQAYSSADLPPGASEYHATLYADPDSDDPAAGPALLAGTGPDDEFGWPGRARAAREHGWSARIWPESLPGETGGHGYVLARGLDGEAVQRAADGARRIGRRIVVEDAALPDGWRAVAAAPMRPDGGPHRGQIIEVAGLGGNGAVSLSTFSASPRALLVVRFLTEHGRSPFLFHGPALAARTIGPTTVVARAYNTSATELDRLLDRVRTVDRRQWDAFRSTADIDAGTTDCSVDTALPGVMRCT
jgi:hypothetical protein